jgi:hypothetical protein
LAYVALWVAPATCWAQPRLAITITKENVHLDGKLDEAFWQQAQAIELTQQAPKPGEPSPFRTIVRAAANQENLYIAFVCIDPAPSQMATHTMQRDGDVTGDDFVSIVLDTYGDRRTGYFLSVNASGARVDGLVSGAERPSLDWDGIWDARTQRTADGWSIEIAIPSRTLNFTRGLDAWGANFERSIPRDRTFMRWSSTTLDSFFYDLSRAGMIDGLGALQQGLGIELSPYAVGRMRDHFQENGRSYQGTPGGDFTYRLTSQMAAVFTVNTDFAETEVDTRQLNLTRFPLLFPERRTFFLEGSNQYEFGLGLDEQFIPFFSRRIGLFEGNQVPITAGVKLNGRAGKWNIGLIDVQMRGSVLRDGEALGGTNLFTTRISYDVTPKLRIGSILTHGSPNASGSNTLAGIDAVWRTSQFRKNKNLFIGLWAAASSRGNGSGNALSATGNRTGYGFKIDYPNDRWDCFVSLNQYGEALDPALGFLPRPGVRRYQGVCEWRPRPRKDGPFGWVRQQFMDHRYLRVVNYRGQVETQQVEWTPVNFQLETGDRIAIRWAPEFQFLPALFEIAEGVTIPVGEYWFHRFGMEFVSSNHRPVEFGNTTTWGTFYNGHLFEQSNYVQYTQPKGRWQAGLTVTQNFGRLPVGSFVQRLWQLNTTYAFNSYISLTNFLQYDTESQNLGNNTRFRWTLRPGNDFFFVWNRGWKRLIKSPGEMGLIPDSELLAVKLRWTFRR